MSASKGSGSLKNGGLGDVTIESFEQMLKNGDLQKIPIQDTLSHLPFFSDWMQYTTQLTDAPDDFLAAGGLQIVSAVLGNRSFITFGNDKIFPHLWMVLVAPSSFYHKTTALNLVKKTVADMKFSRTWQERKRDFNDSDGENKAKSVGSGKELIAPDKFSIDSLLEELQDRPAMLFVQSEFGAFLKEIDKSFNQGAKETLTEIYDSGLITKFTKKIKEENNGKPIQIDDSALSIFSASTRDWLEDYVRLSDISAGFIARYLFVPATNKTRQIGWPAEKDKILYEKIKKQLMRLRNTANGEMDVSAIKPYYELWYKDLFERVQQEETVSKTIGFDQRIAVYVLKFAIIVHIATKRDKVITVGSLIRALQLAEYFRSKNRELFETTFLTRYEKNIRKIAELIYRHDHQFTRRQIQQRASSIGIRANEFKSILETLEEDGDMAWDSDKKAWISYQSKYLKGIVKPTK